MLTGNWVRTSDFSAARLHTAAPLRIDGPGYVKAVVSTRNVDCARRDSTVAAPGKRLDWSLIRVSDRRGDARALVQLRAARLGEQQPVRQPDQPAVPIHRYMLLPSAQRGGAHQPGERRAKPPSAQVPCQSAPRLEPKRLERTWPLRPTLANVAVGPRVASIAHHVDLWHTRYSSWMNESNAKPSELAVALEGH